MEGGKISIERGEEERIGSKRGRDEKSNIAGRLEKKPSGRVVVEEYSYSGDEMINGVKYEEEKISSDSDGGGGGGLFNQLITNLVNSPKSNQQVETNVFKAESEKRNGGEEEEEGGVINSLISNIFSSSNGGEEEKDGGGEVVEKDGGESTIDNIVSQLPRTLSEDAVPATDEASILLHSIIHD